MNTKKIYQATVLSLFLLSASNIHAAAAEFHPEPLSDDVSPSTGVKVAVTSPSMVSVTPPKHPLSNIYAGKTLRKLTNLLDAEKRALFLQNFSQIFDGADGNRDCEQQALMNYRIIESFIRTGKISEEDKSFLEVQMVITPTRCHNSLGFLVSFAPDNGFSLEPMQSAELKSRVANKILADVISRLDPDHQAGYEARLVETTDRFGKKTGLKGFCQVERADAFIRGVKQSKIPLLLTLTQTVVEGDMVTLYGAENILCGIDEKGDFVRIGIPADSDSIPCIQISAVSQFVKSASDVDVVQAVRIRMEHIITNLEKLLRIASYETSLGNGEPIPDFLMKHPSYQETLGIHGANKIVEPRMVRADGDTLSYSTSDLPFVLTHIKCTTLGNAQEYVGSLRSGVTRFTIQDLIIADERPTTKSREALERVLGKTTFTKAQPPKSEDHQKKPAKSGYRGNIFD